MTDTSQLAVSLVKLNEKIGDMEINAQTIITVTKFSMEVVEATKLKGAAQKELAISLVRQVIVEAPISDEKEKLLLDMIDQGILANTIELVVAASKGNLDINMVVAVATGCCKLF
jgi:hypothetical protein